MPVFASAIIAAAGRGERLGGQIPKQFRELGGRPLLVWSVARLAAARGVEEIIVGVSSEWEDRTVALLAEWVPDRKIKVVRGGDTRQETVRRCLAEVDEDAEVVVVHDAARPFIRTDLIERAIEAANIKSAATVAVRPSDTVKIERRARRDFKENLDRDRLWLIQTPQAFRPSLIRSAHDQAAADGFVGTDDTALVERIGTQVDIVLGNSLNLKITTDDDWKIALALIAAGVVESG